MDRNILKKQKQRDLLILFIVSIFSFFSSLWVSSPGIMEVRNFVTAREMVIYNNWVMPTMNGNFRFEKPPLPTWITALFMKAFGTTSSEIILRLPIALLTIGLIFLIYYLVNIATNNHKLAFTTGLMCSTTFMIIKLGTENTWDMFGYIFIFGFVTFIFKGLRESKILNFIIAGFFLGGALLGKGPVPFYGMAIPFFFAYFFTYGFKSLKNNWGKLLFSLIIGVSIAGIWPLLAILKHKDLFLSIMDKEATTWTTKHTKWIFYYLDYYVYTGVWMLFVLASFYKKWAGTKTTDNKFFSFLFFWNFSALILLSLVKMKKDRYALPLYILSPMIAAHIVNYYLKKDWLEVIKKEKIFLKFHFIIMTILSLATPILFYIKGYKDGYINLLYLIFIVFTFSYLGYVFIGVVREKNTLKKGLYFTGILMLTINLTTTWFVERVLREGIRTKYPYLSSVKDNKLISEPIFTINGDEITNVWNIGKRITKIKNTSNLPKEFILLDQGNKDEVLNFLDNDYLIENTKIYYKYSDEDKIIYLYNINKK
ncbi:MAG: glycosyltransferase family 39 protein [Psychrilyobacter sp.]|uniref:ArnT family glycosyltransferase n=1 Tax=Psychrilyobacter sp. TaxID=2586924 RepID=UPI003C767FE4